MTGPLLGSGPAYLKDPETGKRVSRLNPESGWVIHEVPELAIIGADLWQAVKDRQKSLDVKRTKNVGMWDRRRPKYLFSGLLKCGVCGSGFSKVSKDHFGCSSARNKGICTNMRTIHGEVPEDAVLSGLRHHLMGPELCESLCGRICAPYQQAAH